MHEGRTFIASFLPRRSVRRQYRWRWRTHPRTVTLLSITHFNLNTDPDRTPSLHLDLVVPNHLHGSFHHSSRVIHKTETRQAFDHKAYTLTQMASPFPLHRNTRHAD